MTSSLAPCYDIEAARTYQDRPVAAEELANRLRSTLAGGDVFLRRPESSGPMPTDTSVEGSSKGSFKESTLLFNSAAPLGAWIVVRPRCTADVVT